MGRLGDGERRFACDVLIVFYRVSERERLGGHLDVRGGLVRVEARVQVGGGRLGAVRFLFLGLARRLLLRRRLLRGGDGFRGRLTALGRGSGVLTVLTILAVLFRLLLLQTRESLGDRLGLRRSVDDDDAQRTTVELDAVVRLDSLEGGLERGHDDLGRALRLALRAVVDAGLEHATGLTEKFLL